LSGQEGLHVWDKDEDLAYFWGGSSWIVSGFRNFLSLQDTPDNYSGESLKVVRVNAAETGLEFRALTKFDIGLGNVDNTSDLDKPISEDTQNALDLKLDASDQYFVNDISVSLSGGKTLGRYTNGQTIPSQGKTPEEVVKLIAQEPIAPTLTLNSSTIILFNQTAISNVLNFSRVINSLGASVASASLEWRRNNSGAWVVLTNVTSDGYFTHTLTDTNFNTQPFNYRYTVTDSQGATSTVSWNITPQSYSAPSITFSAPAVSITSPESNTIRERGNVDSILQGSTSRNSALVNIISYKFAVSVNGGAYTDITSDLSLAVDGGSFTNLPDTASNAATSITYRVSVTDIFSTTNAFYSINLKYLIFYGDINASTSLDSAAIRGLPYRRFVDSGSPFTFNSGITNNRFIVAWDPSKGLVEALDITQNVPLTSLFITTPTNILVGNGSGPTTLYNALVYTNALPYNPSVTIRITYI
jgi:hypothetical protein